MAWIFNKQRGLGVYCIPNTFFALWLEFVEVWILAANGLDYSYRLVLPNTRDDNIVYERKVVLHGSDFERIQNSLSTFAKVKHKSFFDNVPFWFIFVARNSLVKASDIKVDTTVPCGFFIVKPVKPVLRHKHSVRKHTFVLMSGCLLLVKSNFREEVLVEFIKYCPPVGRQNLCVDLWKFIPQNNTLSLVKENIESNYLTTDLVTMVPLF